MLDLFSISSWEMGFIKLKIDKITCGVLTSSPERLLRIFYTGVVGVRTELLTQGVRMNLVEFSRMDRRCPLWLSYIVIITRVFLHSYLTSNP